MLSGQDDSVGASLCLPGIEKLLELFLFIFQLSLSGFILLLMSLGVYFQILLYFPLVKVIVVT